MVSATTPIKPKTENENSNLYSTVIEKSSGYEHLDDTNDTGNAQRFLLQFGKRVRYISTWQLWLIWNGNCWELDTKQQIAIWFKASVRAAIEVQEQWLKENDDWKKKPKKPTVVELPLNSNPLNQKAYEDSIKMLKEYDNSLRELKAYSEAVAYLKYLKGSLNTGKIKAGIESAQSENVTNDHKALNKVKSFLVCNNGTVDVASGLLQESKQSHLITSQVETAYNEEATCPKWMQFLKEIFITEDGRPDEALIEYMQKLFGCAITGLAPRENIFPIFYGSGGNGKSTFLKVIQTILGGEIAYACEPDFLCESKSNQHPASLATLYGKKIVFAQEPPPGSKLNTSLVKSITGCDQMTARLLYQNPWSFYPECLLLMSTNEKPTVKETTEGIWRRVRLIPFLATFAADTAKRNMAQVLLEEESEGILCWIIAGAKTYLADGLLCPERIKNETEKYQNEEDIVSRWLEDCCTIHTDTVVKSKASDVQASFKKWCELNNLRSSKNDLADGLRKRGIVTLKSGINYWCKIKLNNPDDDPDDGQ
jgi:putative DNA primase/helicase